MTSGQRSSGGARSEVATRYASACNSGMMALHAQKANVPSITSSGSTGVPQAENPTNKNGRASRSAGSNVRPRRQASRPRPSPPMSKPVEARWKGQLPLIAAIDVDHKELEISRPTYAPMEHDLRAVGRPGWRELGYGVVGQSRQVAPVRVDYTELERGKRTTRG